MNIACIATERLAEGCNADDVRDDTSGRAGIPQSVPDLMSVRRVRAPICQSRLNVTVRRSCSLH